MENILTVILVWAMLTTGVVLLSVELLIGTFVVMFFGIAFILTGVGGFFWEWPSGEVQLLVTMILGAY